MPSSLNLSRWKLGLVILLLISLVTAGAACGRQPVKKKTRVRPKAAKKIPAKPKLAVSALDGLEAKPELVKRQALAVMVENLNTIRPQAGISQASMVVEALTEGGITRFMLVFLEKDAGNVGPVRSARTHFVKLAKGLEALYAHVGGSTFAMSAIRQFNVEDIDQFSFPSGFHRISTVRAPHNVFTGTAALRNLKPKENTPPPAFDFKPDLAERKRPASQTISINFSFPNYKVDWVYQPKTNSYLRFNGGKPHTDANTGKQLEAKNILIMTCPTTPIAGTDLLDINVIGGGRLRVIRDGGVVEGSWSKPSVDAPLSLEDSQGGTIKLDPGQVWLEIVAPATTVGVSGK